jgi:hypothetical protein
MGGCLLAAAGGRAQPQAAEPIGLFAGHTDVGAVLHAGSVVYDAAKRSYIISGSGENVWATADAFQFVWKKMEGDFTLTADISVLGQGGDPHKKAMLMARQSLDADSAYADVALHGVGLTSLQARETKGADTHEIQSNISAPKKLRLQKYGDEFTMWLAGEDGVMRMAGGSMRVPMTGVFYVGLGVCAHNKDAVETAEFGKVALGKVSLERGAQIYTTLETIDVASSDRRVTYVGAGLIVTPNWTADGASLVFDHVVAHGEGRIEIVSVAGGVPQLIYAGSGYGVDISPDGKMLAFVVQSGSGLPPMFYLMPIGGGTPQPAGTEARGVLSWPGWSPDGNTFVFTSGGPSEFAIFTTPVAGGRSNMLTEVSMSDMSYAEYSPDGEYIYFNSDRSGTTEIWRMRPDGSQQEQVTNDGAGNYSPRISPDNRVVAFLTPQRGSRFADAFEPLTLRVMSLADRKVRTLAKFTGAHWATPVLSWSPDSKRIAFASYQGQR